MFCAYSSRELVTVSWYLQLSRSCFVRSQFLFSTSQRFSTCIPVHQTFINYDSLWKIDRNVARTTKISAIAKRCERNWCIKKWVTSSSAFKRWPSVLCFIFKNILYLAKNSTELNSKALDLWKIWTRHTSKMLDSCSIKEENEVKIWDVDANVKSVSVLGVCDARWNLEFVIFFQKCEFCYDFKLEMCTIEKCEQKKCSVVLSL